MSDFALKKDGGDNTTQDVVSPPKHDNSDNAGQNLDEKLSKKIALSLLHAVSGEDVLAVLEEHKKLFDNPGNWRFNAKWSTAGNQQSNPIGAFTELVINSMDACLIKKAKKNDIEDLRGENVPQSMQEAVKRFYPMISEGKITNLDDKHKNKIADESIFIGIKRAKGSKKYPTYTIVDFGEGQKPEDFRNTFVSLEDANNNKEGIPFVQGKFKMGSTGVFRFLTREDFKLGRCKLIISKHFNSEKWGWTLVRLREAREDNKNEEMPVVEYFSPNKECVPCFNAGNIQALEHKNINRKALDLLNTERIGVVEQGTIVKLYEFSMGGDAAFRDNRGGLDNALTISLMRCALPIRTYDFDISNADNLGELGKYNIHKRAAFSGAIHYLMKNNTTLVEGFPIAIPAITDSKLGKININVYAVAMEEDNKIKGLKDFLKKQDKRIFYTINGQTHATQNKSVINSRLKFGDLEDYLIIEVVCDGISKTARNEIFLPDRERMADAKIAGTLKSKVMDALKGNDRLRELSRFIKTKKAKEHSENNDSVKLVVEEMIRNNPEIGQLFGAGKDIKPIKATKPKPESDYQGKQFPTRFECKKSEIEIQMNSRKKIIIETDASNDYFNRVKDSGQFDCNNENINIVKSGLKDGKFTITVKPWIGAQVGDRQTCEFSFSDCHNVEPLSCSIDMIIIKDNGQSKRPQPKKPKIKTPDIYLVEKEDQDFDDESGAKVVEEQDGVTIYVNRNNKYLESILTREPEDKKKLYETVFKNAVGLQTFALYNELKDNKCNDYEQASNAIAATMIAVIKETGKEICNY